MSQVGARDADRLVAELAETPGAVPALVVLQDGGGSASRGQLDQAIGASCEDALRWLDAVGLARPADGVRHATYELTEVGTTLIRSLTDFANVLAGDGQTGGQRETIQQAE